MLPELFLKRREERRIRAGHPWVYSNEVDVSRSPLTGFESGAFANVKGHTGQALGTAYVNPATLICARLVSRRPDQPLDAGRIGERLARAISLRERMGVGPYYRMVYGESDGLPGLVVDRFGDTLSVQIATAGMDALSEAVIDGLHRLVAPRAIVLRNDGAGRALEGLAESVEWLHGEEGAPVDVRENGATFPIHPARGQKTGWFYDHRLNRARVASWSRGARVLDLFSYRGGFGVQAAIAGAAEVLCVDSSEEALDGVREAADRNACAARVSCRRDDAFDALRALKEEGRRFDLVVLDPPAFARRKRDLTPAREAYRRLNRLAMGMLGEDGLLFSASCSSHLDRDAFRDLLRGAARGAARGLSLLEAAHQGPDHPVHPALTESDYLKGLLLRVTS